MSVRCPAGVCELRPWLRVVSGWRWPQEGSEGAVVGLGGAAGGEGGLEEEFGAGAEDLLTGWLLGLREEEEWP